MDLSQVMSAAALQFLIRTLGALVLLSAAWIVAAAVGRAIQHGLERTRLELTIARFAAKFFRWVIVILAALACLSIFDVETTSFAALIGASGIAIGLAIQGTLSNFASGVMLLAFRPYRVGDVITTAGITGTVFEIDLFRTTVDTADNRRMTVPNASVFGSTIENTTYHPTRRVDIAIATDSNTDIDVVREALMAAANDLEGALENPPREVVLEQLTATSVEWVVRVWCNTENYWTVRERALVLIKRRLEGAGIGAPE